ncbi:hypothetical protein BDW02DRAFT_595876 [Decorospora gaudefroyi]|uniref:Uncharacterized protein n=1 Tax=Decorospora gaudefroyi TaxID=184978 RepID=A0A6A5KTR7_9PLEO|nr:hypothetical protein BDW02DRAFT_595876 [Decorospora gaudefroyi]
MPGMLTRSKSLRFLRNNRKEASQEDNVDSMPSLEAAPQTSLDKYQSTEHNSRAGGNLGALGVAVRPSTSSGPGQRSLIFHKKTDPPPSIFSQDLIHSFQSPTTSTTVLYTADLTKEQGVIGIALGSPSSGSHWNSTLGADFKATSPFHDSPMASYSHFNAFPPSLSSHQDAPKPKISRWKSLFRKAAPTPQPEKPSFYQLANTVTSAPRADSHHDEEMQEPPVPPKEEKEILYSVSPPTYKPNIRASRKFPPGEFTAPRSPPETIVTRERAQTLGNPAPNDRPTSPMQRAFTTPDLAPRSTSVESSPVPKVVLSKSGSDTPTAVPTVSITDAGPLLDIRLPDITMERYSVMFGTVLGSNPGRSSLLARRQGNAERIKPLNELSAKEKNQQESPIDYSLHRRATSPSHATSSPRLSLFPSTSTNRTPSPLSGSHSMLNRSKKELKRSHTAPAKSPRQQTFAETRETKSNHPKLAPSPPHPTLALTSSSMRSCESEEASDSITITLAQASPTHAPIHLQLDSREPEWEIMSKPVALQSKKTASLLPTTTTTPPPLPRSPSQKQLPKVTKLSALSSHPSSAPILLQTTPPPSSSSSSLDKRDKIRARRAGKVEERSDVGTEVVGVGVARSVSVSRSPVAVVGGGGKREREAVAGERLALTPTMVEVRNRKSLRVVVVDA